MLGSTSGDTHVSAIFLGFGESMNTKYQPGAALKVSIVVFKDSSESAIVKFFDGSVGLTHFICLFEVLRDLKRNLG
jgi:hypothetical protein